MHSIHTITPFYHFIISNLILLLYQHFRFLWSKLFKANLHAGGGGGGGGGGVEKYEYFALCHRETTLTALCGKKTLKPMAAINYS